MASKPPTETPRAQFDQYDFDKGDHVEVDWSEGSGPWDEITGTVEGIAMSAGEVVVTVVDYDQSEWPDGRRYDAAPEWITVLEPADDDGDDDTGGD